MCRSEPGNAPSMRSKVRNAVMVWIGDWPSGLYYARLESRVTQSSISKVAGTPLYKQMTIRNWNTTVKLVALLAER